MLAGNNAGNSKSVNFMSTYQCSSKFIFMFPSSLQKMFEIRNDIRNENMITSIYVSDKCLKKIVSLGSYDDL